MRKRYILSAVAIALSASGCAMDPATEAEIEWAIQKAEYENSHPKKHHKNGGSSEKYLPEQRAGWCKNEVVDRYDTYQADVSITHERGHKVFWKVDSTGKTGYCVFDKHNEFVKIVAKNDRKHFKKTGEIYWDGKAHKWVAPDGTVCTSCTPENGFPVSPKTQDGFFYLPGERMWFDPEGGECHSCTPENGFPIPAR